MKLWAVHFKSEGSDNYYETFRAAKRPTEKQLQEWWENHSTYGEQWEEEPGCRNIWVEEIWEVDPNSPALGKGKK